MADEPKNAPPKDQDPGAPPNPAAVALLMKQKDREIAALIKAEKPDDEELVRKNYGTFADHPQLFEVLHEGVGAHRRGDLVSYRELVIWNGKSGGGPDYEKPHVGKTKANAERLIAMGAIRAVPIPGA